MFPDVPEFGTRGGSADQNQKVGIVQIQNFNFIHFFKLGLKKILGFLVFGHNH
jgi:hypothetical protein